MMTRQTCNDCGARRGIAHYTNGDYCFACGKLHNNKDLIYIPRCNIINKPNFNQLTFVDEIPRAELNWLKSFYINDIIIKDKNIKWNTDCSRIAFLSKDRTHGWLRSVDPDVISKWLFIGDKKKELYYWTFSKDTTLDELVLCEDPVSAVCISKYKDVVALGGTNFTSSLLVPLFLKYKRLTVWLDGDKAGVNAAIKFRNKFKLLKPIKVIRTKKDPKCHTPTEMEQILNEKLS